MLTINHSKDFFALLTISRTAYRHNLKCLLSIRFFYWTIFWGNTASDKIFVLQKGMARLVFAAPFRDPCKRQSWEIKTLPLPFSIHPSNLMLVKSNQENVLLTTIFIHTLLGILSFYSILFIELIFLKSIPYIILILEYIINFHNK